MRDRDGKFTGAFLALLRSAGLTPILCPPSTLKCDAHVHRFVCSIKSECLDRMIFVGSGSLRHSPIEFCAHHNFERPHRGIGNRLIHPPPRLVSPADHVVRDARLGGLLGLHRLAAA